MPSLRDTALSIDNKNPILAHYVRSIILNTPDIQPSHLIPLPDKPQTQPGPDSATIALILLKISGILLTLFVILSLARVIIPDYIERIDIINNNYCRNISGECR